MRTRELLDMLAHHREWCGASEVKRLMLSDLPVFEIEEAMSALAERGLLERYNGGLSRSRPVFRSIPPEER